MKLHQGDRVQSYGRKGTVQEVMDDGYAAVDWDGGPISFVVQTALEPLPKATE